MKKTLLSNRIINTCCVVIVFQITVLSVLGFSTIEISVEKNSKNEIRKNWFTGELDRNQDIAIRRNWFTGELDLTNAAQNSFCYHLENKLSQLPKASQVKYLNYLKAKESEKIFPNSIETLDTKDYLAIINYKLASIN